MKALYQCEGCNATHKHEDNITLCPVCKEMEICVDCSETVESQAVCERCGLGLKAIKGTFFSSMENLITFLEDFCQNW